MIRSRLILLCVALGLAGAVAGCANPGIVQMSPDTYMLT